MHEQTEVRFRITSTTLTPQDIEARVGLKPDAAWKIGDRLGAFGAAARDNGFVLEAGLQPSLPFTEFMTTLIRRLAPAAQKIGQLGPECAVEIVCTLHRKAGPLLTFERDDVRWIGVMGARLRIDTFIISDAPRGGAKPAAGGSDAAAAKL